ncbi:MAG: hypothetical protein EOO99_02835 [Pedobacter sp.]|nr:MAG: hypothetical protein EOO99_02835 [Pedobacter sp.]
MPELVIFLIKMNIVLLLFAAAYFIFLRKLTFYNLNRFFLLIGIFISSLYPLLDVEAWFENSFSSQSQLVQYIPKVYVNEIIAKPSFWENWNIWIWVFWMGITYFGLRFLIQLISLYSLHRQTVRGTLLGLSVRLINKEISPFSFGKNVYINPDLHTESELNSILAHEQIHVREWHTFDIILAEIASIIYWFNPGIWLMKKAVKENLEFIADEKMVNGGLNKKQYQYNLLAVGQLKPELSMVNHFNLSDLKRRIKMMNAKRSAPFKSVLYLFILPLISILTLVFSFKNSKAVEVIAQALPEQVNVAISFVEEKVPLPTSKREQVKPKHNNASIASLKIEPSIDSINKKPEKINYVTVVGYSKNKVSDSIQLTANISNKSKVVIIKTDSTLKEKVVQGFPTKGINQKTFQGNARLMSVRADSLNMFQDVIIRINEVEVLNNALNSLNPDDIESINVVKANSSSKTGKGEIFIMTKRAANKNP